MVRAVVRHVAEEVPGVVHVDPDVRDGADGLHLAARASLGWDADAPALGQILQERIKEAVQTQLGLPVAAVRVTAQAALPPSSRTSAVAWPVWHSSYGEGIPR